MNEKYVIASTMDWFSLQFLNQVCHIKLFNIQSSAPHVLSLPKIAPFSALIILSTIALQPFNS